MYVQRETCGRDSAACMAHQGPERRLELEVGLTERDIGHVSIAVILGTFGGVVFVV